MKTKSPAIIATALAALWFSHEARADTPRAAADLLSGVISPVSAVQPGCAGMRGIRASGAAGLFFPLLNPLAAAGSDRTALPPVAVSIDAKTALEENCGKEIRILPSLVTFFWNPYDLSTSAQVDQTASFNLGTTREISLGIMGEFDRDVRIALFSTLSTMALMEEFQFRDRIETLKEWTSHRFSLLFSLSPAPFFSLGAAGKAQVGEDRKYAFGFLIEARVRF